MELTEQHEQIRQTILKFVETEINPHVEEWEEAEIYPAHEIMKKLGDLGMLGITKPEEYGGLGLDYSYQAVFNEAIGTSRCGGVPMSIGVQTDMATPALARFGSDEVREEFLRPSISGDVVSCIGVSERREEVCAAREAGPRELAAVQHRTRRAQPPPQQQQYLRSVKGKRQARKRCDGRAQAQKDGHAFLRHRGTAL